ncbi:MAG: carboxy terminal-processing peptidase [Victivallaceae bacterium]|nr:carboxy terminal-processing peptidase [Victivallaceae bacterium]
MKMSFRLFFIVALLLCGAAGWSKSAKVYSDEDLRTIAAMTAEILETNHFKQRLIDEKMSGALFDGYLKTLDPNRIFFTQRDVDRFLPMRSDLGDKLSKGDASFAFAVYDILRKRHHAYREFAERRLATPFDFSGDEDFLLDRSEAPRAADSKDLPALWEKQLKNDVLSYRLLDRAMNEAAEKEKKSDRTSRIEAIWRGKTPEERLLRRLRDVGNDIDQREPVEVLGVYLNTLAQLYGPHSNYMPPAIDEDFGIGMSLSLTGIGATLSSDDGYIKVVSVVPGGPAAVDGRLKAGDRIVAVTQQDGSTTDVIDMPVSKAVKFIRGDVGTKVTLTVLPGEKGRGAVPVQYVIVRDRVRLVDSEAKGEVREIALPDGAKIKVGLITLPGFYGDYAAERKGDKNYKSCSHDVRRILEKFNSDKVGAVVIDIRRNGGGFLLEAIRLTGLFITTGPVVQVQTGNRKVQVESDDDASVAYTGPLVILESKMSASSSEIFSAAIRDLGRGLVVGDSRTFGKGTVLSVVPFDRYPGFFGKKLDGGSATYETAMFYRPSGGSVQQLGIEADIRIPSLTESMDIGEMFLDNHLPWNSINALHFRRVDGDLDFKAELLRKSSEKRVAANPEFAMIRRRAELFRKFKDRKTVSLNEQKRWSDYGVEKELQDATERLYGDGDEAAARARQADPVLDEAVNIAAEYGRMETAETAKAGH